MSAQEHPAIALAVAERAVEWLVELQSGPDKETTRRGLQGWLREHPDHERAWQRIGAFNERLSSMKSASPIAHATLLDAAPRSRRRTLKALVLFVSTGSAAWLLAEQTPWRELVADVHTGVGERRSVTLDDGSTVALNSDTAIEVNFGAQERRVRLVSGEILVKTAPSPVPRPFFVDTRHGSLRPLGTRFRVRDRIGACEVAVHEGAVAIHPGHDLAHSRVLQAGEQTRFTRDTIAAATPAVEDAAAWTDGMLVAASMRLDDFLAELGRHRRGQLRCDPAVAALRVSGTYPLGDTDRILEVLGSTLPVEIRFFTRYWVNVGPRS